MIGGDEDGRAISIESFMGRSLPHRVLSAFGNPWGRRGRTESAYADRFDGGDKCASSI